MKILLTTDLHWCQYSSIVRSRGEKYSTRLEHLISSINWSEELAEITRCDFICHLGDFFDASSLNAEEISALEDIKWLNDKKHFFICGNHEMGSHDLEYNSAKVFNSVPNCETISSPKSFLLSDCKTCLCFLPYVLEANRKPISEYFPETEGFKRIILSHNDIAGIQMGQFISKTGFSIEEIENYCEKFINGHLHNGEKITDKIINLGNLCGQNFSEDAEKYSHCAYVLDTDTLRLTGYENPHSFNFYKLDGKLPNALNNNAVITLKCKEKDYDWFQSKLSELKESGRVIEYRILIERELKETEDEDYAQTIELTSVDHLKRFSEYVHENIGVSEIIDKELQEVLR